MAGALVVVLVGGSSRAAVLRVPEDYPSVLAGVDAAVAGDSVLVGPGTWTDREVRVVVIFGTPLSLHGAMFLKPGITVVGVAGAEATILDGGEIVANSVDTVIHALPGSEIARVTGFTITGGGSGVLVSGASPLELTSCHVVANARRGVDAREASLMLTDCLVAENELGESLPQGGVWGLDVNATITGCTFENNVGPGLRLSIAEWPGLTVTLRDCVFRDHSRRGASLGDVGSLVVERCTFFRNSTASGSGGGLSLVRCSGSLRFCTFAFDSADGGGGLNVATSYVRIENNTFYRCHADVVAGSLYLDGPDVGTVANIFDHSTGRRGAVSKEGAGLHPDTGCNLFWASADGDYFGAWVPAPTDIHADPLFCDPVILDFGLQAASPAAPPNSGGCALIGAHDVSCGVVSVEPQSWARLKTLFR